MRSVLVFVARLVRLFVLSVLGFFVMLAAVGALALSWLAGIVCALLTLAAAFMSLDWWLMRHDPAVGRTALVLWALAAAAFAVTPLLLEAMRAIYAIPERRRQQALNRIALVRLS